MNYNFITPLYLTIKQIMPFQKADKGVNSGIKHGLVKIVTTMSKILEQKHHLFLRVKMYSW